MTKKDFENKIKKMIDDGKCDVDVNGYICFEFKRTVTVNLNCFAVLNCDKIKFDNDRTEILSLYRRGIYFGLVDIEEVKDIYMI